MYKSKHLGLEVWGDLREREGRRQGQMCNKLIPVCSPPCALSEAVSRPRADGLLITFSKWNGNLRGGFLPKIDTEDAELLGGQ